VKYVDQRIRKLLRSKDGLVFYPANNPKVVSSNLTPATMGAYEENPLSALLIYPCERSRHGSPGAEVDIDIEILSLPLVEPVIVRSGRVVGYSEPIFAPSHVA
jgi:hypothetical protein